MALTLFPLTGMTILPRGDAMPGLAAIRSVMAMPVRFEMFCHDSPAFELATLALLILAAGMRRNTATTSFALPAGTLTTYGSGGVVLLRRCGLRYRRY